jgi:hypothetical protein
MSKTRIRIQRGVHVMSRNITLALVTAIALGGASLASASAHGFGGWCGGYGFRSFSYDRNYDSYNSNYNYESDFRLSRSHRSW